MVKVKFITSGANSAFGGFSVGDVLVCSEAMAKHLVTDICCAKYMATAEEKAKKSDKPKARKQ